MDVTYENEDDSIDEILRNFLDRQVHSEDDTVNDSEQHKLRGSNKTSLEFDGESGESFPIQESSFHIVKGDPDNSFESNNDKVSVKDESFGEKIISNQTINKKQSTIKTEIDVDLNKSEFDHAEIKWVESEKADDTFDTDNNELKGNHFMMHNNSESKSYDIATVFPNLHQINMTLFEHGYQPLELNLTDIDDTSRSISVYIVDAWAESVLLSVTDLVYRLKSHEKTLLDTSIHNKLDTVSVAAMESHISDLQTKLLEADNYITAIVNQKIDVEEKRAELTEQLKVLSGEHKLALKRAEQQFQASERKARQMESEIERYRAKIASFVAKDSESQAKRKEAINDYQRGVFVTNNNKAVGKVGVVPGRTKNLSGVISGKETRTSMEIIDALERQRILLENDNHQLRSQVVSLTQTLTEYENQLLHQSSNQSNQNIGPNGLTDMESLSNVSICSLISQNYDARDVLIYPDDNLQETPRPHNKGMSPPHHDVVSTDESNHNETIVTDSIQLDLVECKAKIASLSLTNISLNESLHNLTNVNQTLRHKVQLLSCECERLDKELSTRPSLKQHNIALKKIEDLEDNLHRLITRQGNARDLNEIRVRSSRKQNRDETRKLIRKDKHNAELNLRLLESLPQVVMQEVLQSLCRQLNVSDIFELEGSVQSLLENKERMQQMLPLIGQVYSFIIDRQKPGVGVDPRTTSEGGIIDEETTKRVLQVLKRWWQSQGNIRIMEKFLTSLRDEFQRRDNIIHHQDQMGDPIHECDYDDPEVLFNACREVIDYQLLHLQSHSIVQFAELFIESHPEELLCRLFNHIKYMFKVDHIDGMIPTLNKIYLRHEEMKNFLASVRAIVHEPRFNDRQIMAMILDTMVRNHDSDRSMSDYHER